MKKFLSYILISLVIGANLLAPISVGWGKNNLEVKSNKAEANDSIRVTTTATALDTTMSGTVHLVLGNNGWRTSESQVIVFILDKAVPQKVIYTYPIVFHDVPKGPTEGYADSVQEGTFSVPNLTPSTDYEIKTVASQNILGWWQVVAQGATGLVFAGIGSIAGPVGTVVGATLGVALLKTDTDLNNTTMADPLEVTTNKPGDTTTISTGQSTAVNEDAVLPVCSWAESKTWGGCVGRLFYWAIFKPTSYIFGLTGELLDLSVDYSIKDTSYRSSFVVEGWGIVRDFCNMFFIFVLLYIAFGTILNLNSVKTKEMIINVIIIGLLINFSLFTTQVIIDASNILTRVFYNSQSIAIGPKIGGVIQDQRGSNGEIKLSEALVAKINPQKLILQASKADNIQTKQTIQENLKQTNGISATTFILVVILASVVNIVGLITFLMCSLIFISRVIGLWMAMIFAPLAFFSYTIPALQDMEMVGWKKWWPETLKMAFLAPVFIFFMYLIIKFLDTGLGLVINDSASGMNFILGIFIPFIFIMLLLTKAKDIAKKMSGTMGQSITNGLSAAGGIALGGAAIGGALLGRKVIGAGLAKASRSDSAMHLATQKFEHNKKLEEWETNGKKGPKPVFTPPVHGEKLKDANGNIKLDAKGNPLTYKEGIGTSIGAALNAKQMKVGGIDFARSQMDETKKAAGLEGVDETNLSGVNKKKIEDTYNRTKRAETEAAVRKGVGADGKDIFLNDESGKPTIKGEEAYRVANRKRISDEVKNDPEALKNGDVTKSGVLSATGIQKVNNKLNVELNSAVKLSADAKLSETFNKILNDSNKKVGGVERAFSRTNTGSWDARKLSDIKSDQREGIFSKIPVALIGAVAMGVRGGLKSSGMSNGGVKVEGNFMKDLGNTISDSLKSMKVNVDLGHVGETKSSADAHGGGGGAHH